MLENLKSNNKESKAIKFDENRDIDTGEIDPSSGEREGFRVTDIFQKETNKQDSVIKNMKVGLCRYCGQDPCSATCDYR